MPLTFPWANSSSKELDAALARASASPLPALRGDRHLLTGPLPPEFKRNSMPRANGYCIEVNAHGQVFGLMETDGLSGGGFGGSCIPLSALISLLNLWASQQTDNRAPAPQAVQIELF